METSITSSKKEALMQSIGNHSSVLQTISPTHVDNAKRLLDELDFPTSRTEDWKYTRTGKLQNEVWTIQPSNAAITPTLIGELNAVNVVFVNGFYRADLSDTHAQSGVCVSALSALNSAEKERASEVAGNIAKDDFNLFCALNTAFAADGLYIRVDKNTAAEKPIHIHFIQQGETVISLPRLVVDVATSASLHIVTSHHSADAAKAWCNGVAEVRVGSNGTMHWDKIQNESDANFSILQEFVEQEKDSQFTINTLTVNGGWVRNNLSIAINGQNCETNLSGFYMPRRKQLVDNHTLVDHKVPQCNSNELYKGILTDQSTGVFNGKVYVRPDAQKTNAFQNNANIIMSDDAQMNTKPELEIYADDVKCSHGTTTGQFDEEALFYLRARGLGVDSAKRLLVSAFIGDVLNKVHTEEVRAHVRQLLVEQDLMAE